jgi:hypothetical protein
MTAILSDSIRTARKPHTCDQCLHLIRNGERYRRQVHTADGFCTYRAHEDCDAAAAELEKGADLNYDECYKLHEVGDEDRGFLTEKYPGVAARMWPVETENQGSATPDFPA